MQIARRLRRQVDEDHVTLAASGIAFQGFIALVPMLVAAVSVYGLVADPDDVVRLIDRIGSTVPAEVSNFLEGQLESIVAANVGALGLGAILGLASGFWSASTGVRYLIEGINLAYDEDADDRAFWKKRGLAMLLTLLFFSFLAVSAALIAFTAGVRGVPGAATTVGAWLVVGGLLMVVLATLYRYAPDRDEPEWIWVSPGAVVTVIGWVAVSFLFSIYVSNFGTYNETYGSLGTIIVTLLWLFATALVVLLGAELNAEIERQTAADSTTGPDDPSGERNATAADEPAHGTS